MSLKDKKGRILVIRENHGNRYFMAETKEQVYDACLTILKEQEDMWYFRNPPKEPELQEEYLDINLDEGTPMFEAREKIIKENQYKMNSYQEYMKIYTMFHKAISDNNGKYAFWIVDRTMYDDYDFEQLENVT